MYSVTDAADALKRQIEEQTGLTWTQFRLMHAALEKPNVKLGDLCAVTGLACSTMTDLLDRLERKGLVVRERSTDDRRVITVKVVDMTAYNAAKRMADEFEQTIPAAVKQFLTGASLAVKQKAG